MSANQERPQGVCWNCGKPGHIARKCRSPAQTIASTSTPAPPPPASDELVALREQIKTLNERIAAISVDQEKERF